MEKELTTVLEDKTIGIINWLETAIKTSTDFASEQIPLFIQELLHYNFVISLSWFIFGGLLGIVFVGLLILHIRYCFKDKSYSDEMWGAGVIPIILFFAISFPIMSFNTDWIKIKLAPRVYLMEYVKEELK